MLVASLKIAKPSAKKASRKKRASLPRG